MHAWVRFLLFPVSVCPRIDFEIVASRTLSMNNRVIPYHFNKFFDMTLSDLDETWYTGSPTGHM